MSQEILQLGAVAVIFLYAIGQFFNWLKEKKNEKNENGSKFQLMLLNQKIDNHIGTISREITEIKNEIQTIKNEILDLKIKQREKCPFN